MENIDKPPVEISINKQRVCINVLLDLKSLFDFDIKDINNGEFRLLTIYTKELLEADIKYNDLCERIKQHKRGTPMYEDMNKELKLEKARIVGLGGQKVGFQYVEDNEDTTLYINQHPHKIVMLNDEYTLCICHQAVLKSNVYFIERIKAKTGKTKREVLQIGRDCVEHWLSSLTYQCVICKEEKKSPFSEKRNTLEIPKRLPQYGGVVCQQCLEIKMKEENEKKKRLLEELEEKEKNEELRRQLQELEEKLKQEKEEEQRKQELELKREQARLEGKSLCKVCNIKTHSIIYKTCFNCKDVNKHKCLFCGNFIEKNYKICYPCKNKKLRNF